MRGRRAKPPEPGDIVCFGNAREKKSHEAITVRAKKYGEWESDDDGGEVFVVTCPWCASKYDILFRA